MRFMNFISSSFWERDIWGEWVGEGAGEGVGVGVEVDWGS